MPLQNGTYGAVATAVTFDEAKSGAVMVYLDCRITTVGYENEMITASLCLILKDGSVSTITHGTLKSIYKNWDGVDPDWFKDNPTLSDIPFTIVLDWEEYEGKQRLRVKYVNPIGTSRRNPIDRQEFLAKYGSRLRALSGGIPAKPATPAAPKPAPPPPVKPAPIPEPKVTLEDAWNSCCENNPGKSREELTAMWNAALEGVGKPQDEFNSMDWLKVSRSFDNVTV